MTRGYASRFRVKRARDFASSMPDAFTLVELLIAVAIVGVVIGAIYGVFVSSNRSYHTQDSVAETQQGVRVGVDFMVRDIRMAGFDPLDSAGAGIEQATATKLRFTADMNMGNGIENTDRERITYEYDSVNFPNLLRQCLYEGTGSQSWQTLIDNVNALSFGYLDGDGNNIAVPVSTSNLENIRTVVISMTCQGTDAQGQIITRTLNTRVRFRNL